MRKREPTFLYSLHDSEIVKLQGHASSLKVIIILMVENAKTPTPSERKISRDTALEKHLAQEYRRKVALLISTFTGLTILATTIGAAATGLLDPFLRYLGLPVFFHTQRGVYADCSLPENQNNTYCIEKDSEVHRTWKDMLQGGKRYPFGLSDK